MTDDHLHLRIAELESALRGLREGHTPDDGEYTCGDLTPECAVCEAGGSHEGKVCYLCSHPDLDEGIVLWPCPVARAVDAVLVDTTPPDLAGRTAEDPPVAKYRLTVEVTGNSHGELTHELVTLTRGGLLIDSDYDKRDEFRVYGGRSTRTLRHTNPEMTAERYEADLETWFKARRLRRREYKQAGRDALRTGGPTLGGSEA